jgi:hypothetical protein
MIIFARQARWYRGGDIVLVHKRLDERREEP